MNEEFAKKAALPNREVRRMLAVIPHRQFSHSSVFVVILIVT
jgi:hypothetical protein